VALSVDEVEAGWRAKAAIIGTVVLVLCGLTIALSLLFGRELRRRAAMQAELARLSLTDALTGLANRRRFEEVFKRAWKSDRRTGKPLSLLVVDAGHFKGYNDRHGHAVGDEVLRGLARCLSASVHRPDDLVARVGGEEFALLLPDTDEEGAARIATNVHETVATLAVAPPASSRAPSRSASASPSRTPPGQAPWTTSTAGRTGRCTRRSPGAAIRPAALPTRPRARKPGRARCAW